MSNNGFSFWKTIGRLAAPRNLALSQAIGLCPLLAAGTTLKNGVTLAAAMALALLLTALFAGLLGRRMATWLRPPMYVIMGGLSVLATMYCLDEWISTELYASLYLFLPLIAVNTLLLCFPAGESAERLSRTLAEAVGAALGYGFVVCALSALRELMAYNTVWGVPVELSFKLPAVAWPFAALLLLSMMAALLQTLRRRFDEKEVSSDD